jgi:hypothetical protein
LPTFCCPPSNGEDDDGGDCRTKKKIDQAIQNTVAYIHGNDIVPFLSISSVRRLATLLDAVDNQTEKISAWSRWRIFHEYDGIPQEFIDSVLQAETSSHRAVQFQEYQGIPKELIDAVLQAERTKSHGSSTVHGYSCDMIIPARVVVWSKKNFCGTLQAYGCDPNKVANENVFLNQDMLSDHLPDQYEDALDALVA